jgi:hypothetical protein
MASRAKEEAISSLDLGDVRLTRKRLQEALAFQLVESLTEAHQLI